MGIFKAERFTAPAAVAKRTVKDELTDFAPRLMVCVLADEPMVPAIRQAIVDACSTGQLGDGIVWTVDIGETHRIRNGTRIEGEPPQT